MFIPRPLSSFFFLLLDVGVANTPNLENGLKWYGERFRDFGRFRHGAVGKVVGLVVFRFFVFWGLQTFEPGWSQGSKVEVSEDDLSVIIVGQIWRKV